MFRKPRSILILITSIFILSLLPYRSAFAQSALNTQFRITIENGSHQRYGLYYPVTYKFQIPSGSSNLTAQYRTDPNGDWINLETRTSADFFNGINAVRFDYDAGIAYVSVAFSLTSNSIYVRILDELGEVPIAYLGMPVYYDNRHAAVTVTLDDWTGASGSYFNNALQILANAHVYSTAGVITQTDPDWGLIQSWVDQGYVEVASHSRNHPCSVADYEAYGYINEITRSRGDILDHLNLPFPYVPVYLEPCGLENDAIRLRITEVEYLVARGWQTPPVENTFSAWGGDGAYQRVLYSYDTWTWRKGGTATQLAEANSSFDGAYSTGGIYHLVDHPWLGNWYVGENLNLEQHINYKIGRAHV
jgi:hypothetical protein